MDAPAPPPTLPPLDAGRLAAFEAFVAGLRPVFQRSDQSLRFRAYLRGLLEPLPRKNVESIAAAAGAVMMVEADLAQALQHFVSQSPWDARRLGAAVRRQTEALRHDPRALWVVHDGTFAKKGTHSVGVRRQLARSVGRKINCQLGVFVAQVGPCGYFPLAARLYLPSSWLRDNPDAAARHVPEDDRRAATKAEIALELLDALRAEVPNPPAVTAGAGYLATPDLAAGLAARGFTLKVDAPHALAAAARHFDWLKQELGLDHFEGRTWHGWHHHVGLVFTAYAFLASQGQADHEPPFRAVSASGW